MGTIIMLFMLPIGIIVYFFDKKISRQNERMFNDYIKKIKHSKLTTKDKLEKIDTMYYHNDYHRISKTKNCLIVEKKHFNLGVLFIYFGVFSYFGVLFFLLYYYFILKAKRRTVIME